LFIIFFVTVIPLNSFAFWGDGGAGWAQIPYLIKILAENIKRYQQLRMIVNQAKRQDSLIRAINEGLENSIGLLDSLPIKDVKILGQLKDFKESYRKILELYGQIPKSKEAALQELHDQIVAESLQMTSTINNYSKKQEQNAKMISIQSRKASPKGAARMQAETGAKILHTLNQILRINGQMLKLQSQELAYSNKLNKDSVYNYQNVNKGMKRSFKEMKPEMKFIRF